MIDCNNGVGSAVVETFAAAAAADDAFARVVFTDAIRYRHRTEHRPIVQLGSTIHIGR